MGTEVTALQRKWRWQINLGTVAVPVWTTVVGLEEFTPTVTPVDQEDDDYESAGWQGDTRTALKWGLGATIKYRQDNETFVANATHEKLRNAAAAIDSAAGVVHQRWYDRFGGVEAYEGYGLITWEPSGGGMTDLNKVGVTVGPSSTSPALVTITNPLNTAPDPIVSAVNPATGPAAGGTLVSISGAHFTGVTGVTVGGVAATSFLFVSDSVITAVTPAHAAGAVAVEVTTPNGVHSLAAAYTYTA